MTSMIMMMIMIILMYCWLWHFNFILHLLCHVILSILFYYSAILATTSINACLLTTWLTSSTSRHPVLKTTRRDIGLLQYRSQHSSLVTVTVTATVDLLTKSCQSTVWTELNSRHPVLKTTPRPRPRPTARNVPLVTVTVTATVDLLTKSCQSTVWTELNFY